MRKNTKFANMLDTTLLLSFLRNTLLPGRLMVGLWTLNPSILVRIQARQQLLELITAMQYKIEIELICRRAIFFGLLLKSQPLQSVPFEIGLKLTNIGNVPFSGSRIENISWKSAAGQKMYWEINKSYLVDVLYPEAEAKLWIDKAGSLAHGLCSISLVIKPQSAENSIMTYQVDPFTGVSEAFGIINAWSDFFILEIKMNMCRVGRIHSCSCLRLFLLFCLSWPFVFRLCRQGLQSFKRNTRKFNRDRSVLFRLKQFDMPKNSVNKIQLQLSLGYIAPQTVQYRHVRKCLRTMLVVHQTGEMGIL